MRVYCKKTKGGQPRWYIEYRVGGKKVKECVGQSRKVAEKALAVRRTEILQGRYNLKKEIKSLLFEDFAKEYIEYSKANKRSYERDVSIMKALLPHFKNCRLSKITPFMVERYKIVREQTVAKSTINRELSCLRHMFNTAIKWGKAQHNPLHGIKPYKVQIPKERILTLEEAERLLVCCNGHTRDIVVLALNTGMRLREILGLKREDINLNQGHIKIKHSKTGKPRIIPMNPVVKETLSRVERTENPYIFFDPRNGKPYNHIRTSFSKALKRAGISGFRFHDLRHTAATYMVLAGADLATVKEVLGHSSIEMTMRYFHPTPESKLKAVNALGIFTANGSQCYGHQERLTTHEESGSAHFLPTWGNRAKSQVAISPCNY